MDQPNLIESLHITEATCTPNGEGGSMKDHQTVGLFLQRFVGICIYNSVHPAEDTWADESATSRTPSSLDSVYLPPSVKAKNVQNEKHPSRRPAVETQSAVY